MNNNDTKTIRIIAAIALVVLVVGAHNLPALAQDSQKAPSGKDFTIGKKGEVHFNIPVKAGSAVLKPGMYQVQDLGRQRSHHRLQENGDARGLQARKHSSKQGSSSPHQM